MIGIIKHSRLRGRSRSRSSISPPPIWAGRWGFSVKTVREWFRDEFGPGILRQRNIGRRSKRDYTTIMISPSAAARVYAKRIRQEVVH